MLAKLVEAFDHVDSLPIEIAEVRDRIIELGYQDEIVIDGRQQAVGKLWGAIYQYTRRSGVYGDAVRCTIVAYNTELPIPTQRVVWEVYT